MAILHLTKDNFDETIAEGKCIVDFWAGWCGPCKMLAPMIEQLDEKFGAEAKICKVDVDDQSELARRFGVMSIPTVISFSNGEETGKVVGVQPMEALEKLITKP